MCLKYAIHSYFDMHFQYHFPLLHSVHLKSFGLFFLDIAVIAGSEVLKKNQIIHSTYYHRHFSFWLSLSPPYFYQMGPCR